MLRLEEGQDNINVFDTILTPETHINTICNATSSPRPEKYITMTKTVYSKLPENALKILKLVYQDVGIKTGGILNKVYPLPKMVQIVYKR